MVQSGHNGIVELVRAATVIITTRAGGQDEPFGSGFFVAPGWVLTCAHVVKRSIVPRVLWRDRCLTPVEIIAVPEGPDADDRFPYPDAALLKIELSSKDEELCVPITLDRPAPGAKVWAYGFNKIRTGWPERDGARLVVADATPGQFIRLQEGQLAGGTSGGPVLSLESHQVFGIAKATQDETFDAGGWVAPIAEALTLVDHDLGVRLIEENTAFHAETIRAMRLGQVMLGGLPDLVRTRLTSAPGAIEALRLQLNPPVSVSDADVPEWIARRLFGLDLDELGATLMAVSDLIPARVAMTVFDYVACGVTAARSLGWWIPGDAASLVRSEAAVEAPRVLWFGTEEDVTVGLLLRRAIERGAWDIARAGGPVSAEATGEHGLPEKLLIDLRSELTRKAGGTDLSRWERDRTTILARLRTQNVYLKLRVDGEPDLALLAGLRAEFQGFRLLISKRGAALPDGSEETVLELRPAIDEDSEYDGISSRRALLGNLGLAVDHRVA